MGFTSQQTRMNRYKKYRAYIQSYDFSGEEKVVVTPTKPIKKPKEKKVLSFAEKYQRKRKIKKILYITFVTLLGITLVVGVILIGGHYL